MNIILRLALLLLASFFTFKLLSSWTEMNQHEKAINDVTQSVTSLAVRELDVRAAGNYDPDRRLYYTSGVPVPPIQTRLTNMSDAVKTSVEKLHDARFGFGLWAVLTPLFVIGFALSCSKDEKEEREVATNVTSINS